MRQRSADGQSIINAASSREQGVLLSNVTVFVFDQNNRFMERIEAKAATLEPGHWRLEDARVYRAGRAAGRARDLPAQHQPDRRTGPRNLLDPRDGAVLGTARTSSRCAEHAGLSRAGYRLQYQKLLARPFLLAAMVLLAAAVSLRFFRFGGVQKMVLGGVAAGFLLYVLSKVTDDLSKAELITPIVAAWLPVAIGGLTGFVALLYQEDG